jgi:hypothetical protein
VGRYRPGDLHAGVWVGKGKGKSWRTPLCCGKKPFCNPDYSLNLAVHETEPRQQLDPALFLSAHPPAPSPLPRPAHPFR